MSKQKRPKPRNPVACASIMSKGGAHTVSRSAERSRRKRHNKQLMRKIKAGRSGLDAVWALSIIAVKAPIGAN